MPAMRARGDGSRPVQEGQLVRRGGFFRGQLRQAAGAAETDMSRVSRNYGRQTPSYVWQYCPL